jgi:asparagine synthase (glutamine-hydrolysing)
MCGIAGFYGSGTVADIHAMAAALHHRGPDGYGFYSDPDVPLHLGHSRLAVIDLDHGAQPMWDRDGTIGIVFNGEIYNHGELRRELEILGHVFQTDHSDTEVLIYGWKQWGQALAGRLNGMFAFAIWDRRTRLLHLARDRFGEKPLYWSLRNGNFLFASELTAFRAHSAFQVTYDSGALAKLFAYGFIPAPAALYKDCQKLPAGHWLEYRFKDNRVEQGAYWTFRIEPASNPPDEEAAAEELQKLLREAVERRLVSDVPLGIFLSGGIDSSTIAALAAEVRDIQTFSVGFTEKSYDESQYARLVGHAIGSRHREEQLTMRTALDLMPEILARLDEPIADPSILPTFLLSRFTRRHVTVALSGDGGDELLAGYDTFAALGPARFYQALMPAAGHRTLAHLIQHLPLSSRNMSLDFKLRRALGGIGHAPEQWNPRWLAPVQPEELVDLLNMPVDPEAVYSEAIALWREAASADPMDRTMEFYVRLYLQNGILAKVDRASMMNSLETRAVFLDPAVVEFVRRLPARYKYRRGMRKRILKRAMRNRLPKRILARRKKGFGIPLQDWLKSMPDVGPVEPAPRANVEVVKRWEREHRAGAADHRLGLWTWRVLGFHAQASAGRLDSGGA